LYKKRGDGETKCRKEAKNVPSRLRDKLFKFRRVPMAKEALKIIQVDHDEHHEGHNTSETRINEKFYIDNLRKKVIAVGGNNCSICAPHAPVLKRPVQPILTTRKGELVMFDLTKFYVPVTIFTCFLV
jgi:hypothetical protein